jgi:hypothetical protein
VLVQGFRLFLLRQRHRFGEQHAKAQIADDHAAGDPQPGDRDAEERHDHAAGNEEHRQNEKHVDAAAPHLLGPFGIAHALRDRCDEAGSRDRIDDGQQAADGAQGQSESFKKPIHAMTSSRCREKSLRTAHNTESDSNSMRPSSPALRTFRTCPSVT